MAAPDAGSTALPRVLADAADRLRHGALALFPTETLIGIGCAAELPRAVRRLVRLKGRAPDHPFPVLLPDDWPLARVANAAPAAARLAERFWPGSLTLVLPALPSCPVAGLPADGTIAVRRSAHPVARGLANALDGLLVATSANPSGAPPAREMAAVDSVLRAGVEVVVDGPPTPGGRGSTIVRVSADGRWEILREGALDRDAIVACAGEKR